MPASPSPRPQLKQSRSSGWGWPHLVDVKQQQQKEKPAQAKQTKVMPKPVSSAGAAPPPQQRDLGTSSELSTLKEEESTVTSTTHSPGSPRDNMSGHRAETSENANAADDQPESGVNDRDPTNVPLLGDESQAPEAQNANHGEQTADDERVVEGAGKDAEHQDESLPGSFPITPAPVDTPGDRFPGLVLAGLLPTIKEPDTASPDSRYPGLAQTGLLPATDPVPEERTAEPRRSLSFSKKDRRVSISEPQKPLPIPKITIQQPSTSEFSDIGEDDIPAQSSSTPKPRATDSVLAEERRGSEHRSLKERLDEERRITTELTEEDRERIIQDIATDMAAVPASATEQKFIAAPKRVKKRMKVRRAMVRGPVLKLLLGRQLAGSTKEILKMRALGQPITLGGTPGLPAVAADGSTDIPPPVVIETEPMKKLGYPSLQKRLAGYLTASDSCSMFSDPETPESQQVWCGEGRRTTVEFPGSWPLGQIINAFTWPDFN